MRASLARPIEPGATATSLLDPAGARVVLGPRPVPEGLEQPIVPAANTLFGPRGACLASSRGPLFVCDTGHHRLLVWRRAPEVDHAPADLLVGQPDFSCEGRNGKGPVGPATLNVPTGVAAADGVLAVADAWNHRVLIWRGGIERMNQPADVIVGQIDRTAALANRGADRPRADTLNWCYGVAIAQGRLYISDTGNRRVLVYDHIPESDGASADLVLGQADFVTRDENAGRPAGPVGMRWPHAIAVVGEVLLISDAGDNRIMGYRGLPSRNGTPCDFVLGQRDCASVDHNQATYLPTASALNMPYGLAVQGRTLLVADTANSRLLGFDIDGLSMGAKATSLTGQRALTHKGDNRWSAAKRDSLCWPYAVSISGTTAVVADSGNNRVLLWERA